MQVYDNCNCPDDDIQTIETDEDIVQYVHSDDDYFCENEDW